MISDEALMLEFQRGSRAAFDELFARHRDALYGFFRRRLDDRGLAEDLTQETFLALLRGRSRYEPRALVRTYLYGIALKQLYAARRRRELAPMADDIAAPCDAGESLWVRQALGRLDAEEREILMLREYEQLSYIEIAELLRIPVNTVRSRLFRVFHRPLDVAPKPARGGGAGKSANPLSAFHNSFAIVWFFA